MKLKKKMCHTNNDELKHTNNEMNRTEKPEINQKASEAEYFKYLGIQIPLNKQR